MTQKSTNNRQQNNTTFYNHSVFTTFYMFGLAI